MHCIIVYIVEFDIVIKRDKILNSHFILFLNNSFTVPVHKYKESVTKLMMGMSIFYAQNVL